MRQEADPPPLQQQWKHNIKLIIAKLAHTYIQCTCSFFFYLVLHYNFMYIPVHMYRDTLYTELFVVSLGSLGPPKSLYSDNSCNLYHTGIVSIIHTNIQCSQVGFRAHNNPATKIFLQILCFLSRSWECTHIYMYKDKQRRHIFQDLHYMY